MDAVGKISIYMAFAQEHSPCSRSTIWNRSKKRAWMYAFLGGLWAASPKVSALQHASQSFTTSGDTEFTHKRTYLGKGIHMRAQVYTQAHPYTNGNMHIHTQAQTYARTHMCTYMESTAWFSAYHSRVWAESLPQIIFERVFRCGLLIMFPVVFCCMNVSDFAHSLYRGHLIAFMGKHKKSHTIVFWSVFSAGVCIVLCSMNLVMSLVLFQCMHIHTQYMRLRSPPKPVSIPLSCLIDSTYSL